MALISHFAATRQIVVTLVTLRGRRTQFPEHRPIVAFIAQSLLRMLEISMHGSCQVGNANLESFPTCRLRSNFSSKADDTASALADAIRAANPTVNGRSARSIILDRPSQPSLSAALSARQ
jgi:hypothetical protein